nr:hypothetical protein [Tanacetum cinerariifolium]
NDDMLGYESEKYSDDEDAEGTNHTEDANETNHSDLKLVKRGITRIYKFRREYGKPGEIKIKEKPARGKMARSKNVYHHKMGRGGYVFVKEKMIENKEIEADEEPVCGIMWLKGRVNKDGEFTDDEIRSVGDKLKEADDKIKKGTLNLVDGTDAKTIVFGEEKEKLSTKMTEKDVLVKKLSNEMTETKGMLSQLMNQLVAQGVSLNLSSQMQVASDVTPMGAYEVDRTQSSVVVRDKDARIQKKSNGLITLEKASKCKLWQLKKSNFVALGTIYKSDGKQMLHNQALPNDCYKVSVDSSLVDAACIPDVGNNGLRMAQVVSLHGQIIKLFLMR